MAIEQLELGTKEAIDPKVFSFSALSLVELAENELPPKELPLSNSAPENLGQSVTRSYAIAEFLRLFSPYDDPDDVPYDQN